MKLLLAEDTRDLNRVVTAMLRHEGYIVDSAYDGEEALVDILSNGYDAIILDIMMPKMDGLSVLREIRKRGIITPVLLLTAKAEVDDRVEGLDAGADDYLPKPFAMKELLARIRAMTRRKTEYTKDVLRFGDFTLNAENFELASENSVRLSVKEFALLQTFMLNEDKALDTEYIIEHVWEGEKESDASTVWLYVNYLKRKLSSIDSNATISGEKGGPYQLVMK
ncbi:MAG: response regulator transcription factor [Lachnospiraceae bacterium]|jgi:DNA-binding response OmpR family regulator|nr:response regulator transcription factor [Lachnospiraceae bacterium]